MTVADSPEPDSTVRVNASIKPLVAWTITVGVTTATTAVTAMKTVNGGQGAMKMRYQKTANAHRSLAVLSRFFISTIMEDAQTFQHAEIISHSSEFFYSRRRQTEELGDAVADCLGVETVRPIVLRTPAFTSLHRTLLWSMRREHSH